MHYPTRTPGNNEEDYSWAKVLKLEKYVQLFKAQGLTLSALTAMSDTELALLDLPLVRSPEEDINIWQSPMSTEPYQSSCASSRGGGQTNAWCC